MTTNSKSIDILGVLAHEMAALAAKVANHTVLVNARRRLPVSGILVHPGIVITVDHGVEKEDGIEVLRDGGEGHIGKLLGRDTGTDLAVIGLENRSFDAGPIPSGIPARVGLPVLMIGRPELNGYQASFGVVSTVGSGLKTVRGAVLDQFIATDATPFPGFSGGPLVSLDGNFLGINTSGLVGGVSLAIPMGLALNIAEQLISTGKVKRGFIGIRSQRVSLQPSVASMLPKEQRSGLLVVGLDADGPAASAGVLIGDILVGVGEKTLTEQDDLMAFLSAHAAGTTQEFVIIRGGSLKKVAIPVGVR